MLFKKKIFNSFESNVTTNIDRSLISKSISIKITKNCINVIAPFLISDNKIKELLENKYNWIKKQLLIQEKIKPLIKKKYSNGEEFNYLGVTYNLKIIKSTKNQVRIESNFLNVEVKNTKNIIKIKKLIHKWFNEKSACYFKEKTYFYAKKNNLKITSVKIREYKARWGSCSVDGNITFNWRLIMAPPIVIKYVIIHELVHLIEHNHSPKYWKQVKKLYPNIDEAKKWLIYNGKTLNI